MQRFLFLAVIGLGLVMNGTARAQSDARPVSKNKNAVASSNWMTQVEQQFSTGTPKKASSQKSFQLAMAPKFPAAVSSHSIVKQAPAYTNGQGSHTPPSNGQPPATTPPPSTSPSVGYVSCHGCSSPVVCSGCCSVPSCCSCHTSYVISCCSSYSSCCSCFGTSTVYYGSCCSYTPSCCSYSGYVSGCCHTSTCCSCSGYVVWRSGNGGEVNGKN